MDPLFLLSMFVMAYVRANVGADSMPPTAASDAMVEGVASDPLLKTWRRAAWLRDAAAGVIVDVGTLVGGVLGAGLVWEACAAVGCAGDDAGAGVACDATTGSASAGAGAGAAHVAVTGAGKCLGCDGGEEEHDGCVGAVVVQVDEEEGEGRRIDDESKRIVGCENDDETIWDGKRMSKVGFAQSEEAAVFDERDAVVFTPKALARGTWSFFASCPVERMMTSFGGGVGVTSKLRNGSSLLIERLSKSDSLKGLRS